MLFSPCFLAHQKRGEGGCTAGSQRVLLNPLELWVLAGPGGHSAALRAAGNCSPLGVLKADAGERAEEARSRVGHALRQARVLLAGRL